MKTLHLRVPCSTSNLGPGFDLLGLALSLYVEVEATRAPNQGKPHTLEPASDFAATWPSSGGLLQRAFDATFKAAGLPSPAQHFRVQSQVPIARGLGSSGAAVAAGLLLAQARIAELHGPAQAPTTAALHEIGIAIEGHPDNVTASLFGGCTLSIPKAADHDTVLIHQPVASSLAYAVAWSDATTTTAQARQVLPAQVPFRDAVENPRRLAALLEGLRTGDPELLRVGAHDRLHHAARLALIPGGHETLVAAKSAGAWLVAINGSGSSLLAMGAPADCPSIALAMQVELAQHDSGAISHCLDFVQNAPQVTGV